MPSWLYRTLEEWVVSSPAGPLMTTAQVGKAQPGAAQPGSITAAPPAGSFGPFVADQFIAHDAVLVRLGQDRDAVSIAFGNSAASPPSVFDALAASEDVRVQIGVTPSVLDTLVATDAANALLGGVSIFVLETGAPAELVQAFLNVLTVSVNDVTPAAEDVRVSFGLEVIALDANPVTDAVTLLLGLQVLDAVSVGEAVGIQMSLGVTAVDVVTPTESVAGEFNKVLVTVSDSVTVTDAVDRHGPFVVQVFDEDVVDERRFAATAKVKKVRVRP